MVLHGSPWVYTYYHWHPMIIQQQPKGLQGLSEVTQEGRFFCNPMPA